MVVWLWDTEGPGSHAGGCDSEADALHEAEACLRDGRAVSARVEAAYMHFGGFGVLSRIQRCMFGWQAVRAGDGSVTWVSLSPLARAAS